MKTAAFLIFFLSFSYGYSQYVNESVMYSRSGIYGTARTAGVAGAFGSVGADLGSVNINPAGLGLYRTTDFSITPGLQAGSNETDFNNSSKSINATKVFLGQVGVEWTKLMKKPTAGNEINFSRNLLRSITFAVTYDRQNFFTRSQSFEGTNATTSMIDNYVNAVNNTGLPVTTTNYPIEVQMAYETYLIDAANTAGPYFSNVNAPVTQYGTIVNRGGTNKLAFSFGGNMNDKVYFGLGIGIPFLNYTTTTTFTEDNIQHDSTLFIGYDVGSRLNVSGTGITGNLGLIYRPAKWLRVGLAYQLPTWYTLSETYGSSMASYFDTADYSTSYSYPEAYRYKMRTPMKGTASASFFMKQYGFFSVDYEFQNFGASRYTFKNEATFTNEENDKIKAAYGFNHTIRAGFEGAYKALRLRTGYAFSSSPYKANMVPTGYAQTKNNITAGIGIRLKAFYTDFAYVYGITKDISSIYAANDISNRYATHTFMLTIGWKVNRERNEPVVTGAGSSGDGGGGAEY